MIIASIVFIPENFSHSVTSRYGKIIFYVAHRYNDILKRLAHLLIKQHQKS
jgi:lauroyl/myristoyl acyltransferase